MLPTTFDRETLLDLVVNAVPLGMLVGFTLLFVLYAPYGIDPVASAIQLTLVLVPLGALVVLSYHAAKAVERAEAAAEQADETDPTPTAAAQRGPETDAASESADQAS